MLSSTRGCTITFSIGLADICCVFITSILSFLPRNWTTRRRLDDACSLKSFVFASEVKWFCFLFSSLRCGGEVRLFSVLRSGLGVGWALYLNEILNRLIKRPMFVPKTCWTSNGLSAFLDLVWMHISWTFLLHGINLVYRIPTLSWYQGIREGKTFRDSFIKITFKSEEKISYIIKKKWNYVEKNYYWLCILVVWGFNIFKLLFTPFTSIYY